MNIETTFFKATDGVDLKGVMYKNQSKTNKVLISIHGMATSCLKERDEKIAEKACACIKGNVYHRSDVGTTDLVNKLSLIHI